MGLDQTNLDAAAVYVDTLKESDILIVITGVGAAWQNGYAERLIRTIKEEAVDLSEYRDHRRRLSADWAFP